MTTTHIGKRWRNALIIMASMFVGFYAGGGYRLQSVNWSEFFTIRHSQGDDLATDISSYLVTFIFCGGAGAGAGAGLSGLALFALEKRKRT